MRYSIAGMAHPSIVDTLSEMNKLGKKDPKLFEAVMQFMLDFVLVFTSDDCLNWVRKHPKEEGAKLLREELKKRLPQSVFKPSSSDDYADFASDIPKFFEAMREVFAADKTRRHLL